MSQRSGTRNLPLSVTSETGRLREVIMHAPDEALERVIPRNFGRMLMDDILFLREAWNDHDELRKVLEHAGVKVNWFGQLLLETLVKHSKPSLRKELIQAICDLEGGSPPYRNQLMQMSPQDLARACIIGALRPPCESLTSALRNEIYDLPPLPNLMFVRDIGAIIDGKVLVGSMAHGVRARETLLFQWIVTHHERFHIKGRSPRFWLDEDVGRRRKYVKVDGTSSIPRFTVEGGHFRLHGVKNLRVGDQDYVGAQSDLISDDVLLNVADMKLSIGQDFVLEGGNVIALSPSTLLVGCNQRASATALEALAIEMFKAGERIQTVLVAVQSQQRPDFHANHLDTGFAIIFRDQTHLECLVHDQMIDPKGSGMTVFKMTYEHEHLRVEPKRDLKSALQEVAELRGTQVTLIPCGGEREATKGKVLHRIRQEREWHNQAVNVLVIGSGKIVAFGRNQGTIEALKLNGYELWSAAEFLTWAPQKVDNWMASASKGIITVRDGELSRAHGGPRSLVFPLRRE